MRPSPYFGGSLFVVLLTIWMFCSLFRHIEGTDKEVAAVVSDKNGNVYSARTQELLEQLANHIAQETGNIDGVHIAVTTKQGQQKKNAVTYHTEEEEAYEEIKDEERYYAEQIFYEHMNYIKRSKGSKLQRYLYHSKSTSIDFSFLCRILFKDSYFVDRDMTFDENYQSRSNFRGKNKNLTLNVGEDPKQETMFMTPCAYSCNDENGVVWIFEDSESSSFFVTLADSEDDVSIIAYVSVSEAELSDALTNFKKTGGSTTTGNVERTKTSKTAPSNLAASSAGNKPSNSVVKLNNYYRQSGDTSEGEMTVYGKSNRGKTKLSFKNEPANVYDGDDYYTTVNNDANIDKNYNILYGGDHDNSDYAQYETSNDVDHEYNDYIEAEHSGNYGAIGSYSAGDGGGYVADDYFDGDYNAGGYNAGVTYSAGGDYSGSRSSGMDGSSSAQLDIYTNEIDGAGNGSSGYLLDILYKVADKLKWGCRSKKQWWDVNFYNVLLYLSQMMPNSDYIVHLKSLLTGKSNIRELKAYLKSFLQDASFMSRVNDFIGRVKGNGFFGNLIENIRSIFSGFSKKRIHGLHAPKCCKHRNNKWNGQCCYYNNDNRPYSRNYENHYADSDVGSMIGSASTEASYYNDGIYQDSPYYPYAAADNSYAEGYYNIEGGGGYWSSAGNADKAIGAAGGYSGRSGMNYDAGFSKQPSLSVTDDGYIQVPKALFVITQEATNTYDSINQLIHKMIKCPRSCRAMAPYKQSASDIYSSLDQEEQKGSCQKYIDGYDFEELSIVMIDDNDTSGAMISIEQSTKSIYSSVSQKVILLLRCSYWCNGLISINQWIANSYGSVEQQVDIYMFCPKGSNPLVAVHRDMKDIYDRNFQNGKHFVHYTNDKSLYDDCNLSC